MKKQPSRVFCACAKKIRDASNPPSINSEQLKDYNYNYSSVGFRETVFKTMTKQ